MPRKAHPAVRDTGNNHDAQVASDATDRELAITKTTLVLSATALVVVASFTQSTRPVTGRAGPQ
ncbi:hypothetical protein PTKU46_87860 [Paraburkholderia terrae]